MATSNMKASIPCDIHSLWKVITEIDFTEQVTAKKIFMKPFIKSYLKKQQAQFVADLKKAVLASVYQGTIRSKMADLRSCCVTFTPRTSSTRRSSALQERKSSHF